ncbi:MAG: hypothetical protein Q8O00_02885, partial [Holophaga sp.]|nr:hypothetical protein [Holophaga sp.]
MTPSEDFLISLHRAVKARQLYAPIHPKCREAFKAFEDAYRRLLEGKPQVQFATRNGRFFVDRLMQDSEASQIKALAQEFEDRSIQALVCYAGAETNDLDTLIGIFGTKPAQLRTLGGAKKHLEDQGITMIRILATRLEEVSETGQVSAALLETMVNFVRRSPAAPSVPETNAFAPTATNETPTAPSATTETPLTLSTLLRLGFTPGSGIGSGPGSGPGSVPGGGSGSGPSAGSSAGSGAGSGPTSSQGARPQGVLE